MKASNSLFVLLLALFFGLSSSLFAADAQLGTVKLVGVTGNVTIQQAAADSSHVAAEGQVVTQGYTIKTGPNSSLVLVFSNGVTVYVGPNTVLTVDSFTQILEGTPVNRPLDEVDAEQGTSKVALHLISGSIVVKADKLNENSLFTVRDANVQSQVVGNAIYSQSTTDAVSIIKVDSGKVLTKVTGQEQQTEREQGEHLFQNGEHKTTENHVDLSKELDTLTKVEQTNGAPNPVTEEGAKAIDESIEQLPKAEETPPEGTPPTQDPETPSQDPNDINNAPTFENPVTGEDVLPPNTSSPDNEVLQPGDVFPGPTPPTPPGPGPTPPPVSVIE